MAGKKHVDERDGVDKLTSVDNNFIGSWREVEVLQTSVVDFAARAARRQNEWETTYNNQL